MRSRREAQQETHPEPASEARETSFTEAPFSGRSLTATELDQAAGGRRSATGFVGGVFVASGDVGD